MNVGKLILGTMALTLYTVFVITSSVTLAGYVKEKTRLTPVSFQAPSGVVAI